MPGFPFSVRVEAAFTGASQAASPVWTDITDRVTSVETNRGRAYFTDVADAGTLLLELDNSDGAFDPLNTSSPYFGGIRPNRRVRVTAQQTPASPVVGLFEGYANSWRRRWPGGGDYSTTTVAATDLFKPLAKRTVTGLAPQAGCAQRIRDLADLAGLVFVDAINLPGYSSYTAIGMRYDRDNLLQAMQDAARSDGGPLFVSGAGALVYQASGYRTSSPRATTSLGTFGNVPGAIPVEDDLEPSVDDERLANVVSITDATGLQQTFSDGPGVALDGRLELDLGATLLIRSAAEQRANDVLIASRDVKVRFASVTLDALTDDQAMAAAFNREIGDRITLAVAPQGGGTTTTQDQFIESVRHRIQPGPGATWTTTFQLSAA